MPTPAPQIYNPISSFILHADGEWETIYESDLVKYATVVDNKYGIEILANSPIMNVFLLNNGLLVGKVSVSKNNFTYPRLDKIAKCLIESLE